MTTPSFTERLLPKPHRRIVDDPGMAAQEMIAFRVIVDLAHEQSDDDTFATEARNAIKRWLIAETEPHLSREQ